MVVVTVGIGALVREALRLVAPRGRVVLFAGFPSQASVVIDPNEFHYGELSLTGSYWIGTAGDRNFDLYPEAASLIAGGSVPVEQLITRRFSLDEIEEAFLVMEERQCLKAMVIP